MEWSYSQPVKIIFGTNKIRNLNEILLGMNLENGLLVCDPRFKEDGLANKVIEYSNGLLTEVFYNIRPNPTVENVDECAALLREKKCTFIVALGGGSSLDCAKAAASCAVTKYSICDFHNGSRKFTKDHLPLIAIPTTSGTGSEVTPVAVLSDVARGVKAPIAHDNFFPDLAIIDPSLTLTVPQKVTASTGLDVLAHALEGFWSKNHQPICDAMALHAAKLTFEYLPKAYENGEDIEAREKMSEASVIAGLAFGLPKTAASHACSFPLTNLYHIPHGEACALTLDYFTRLNATVDDGRLHLFAKDVGFSDANDMADRIFEMKRSMGLLTKLSVVGVKEDDLQFLAKESMHPNMLNNPYIMKVEELVEMYRELM